MKSLLIGIGLLIIAAVGWYLISPLFITVEVDDAVPTAAMPSGVEKLSAEEKVALDTAMDDAAAIPVDPMEETMPTDEPGVSVISPVVGTAGHPASGSVRIVETDTGLVLRYEDFKTINGPALRLYLAKDLDAADFIDLGPVRGTEGNINYSVPAGVDLNEYRYAMYWCEPFSVLFNYADLSTE